MNGCIYQTDDERCMKFSTANPCRGASAKTPPCGYRVPSNYDCIVHMNPDVLANWLTAMLNVRPFESVGNDYEGWLSWLKSPAKEIDNG